MFPVSDRFSEAAAGSHESAVKLEAWSLGVKLGEAVPGGPEMGGAAYFSDGEVRDEFVTGVRRTLSLSVPQNRTWLEWLTRPLELRPFTGISFGNTVEWCPQGRFVVKTKPRSLRPGQLSLKANDFWERVAADDFDGSRSYGGQQFELRGLIRQFIQETGDYPTVVERATSTVTATQIYVWEEGRVKAIADLCASIGATAYFDREGIPVVEDLAQQAQVLTVEAALIDLTVNVDWSRVFNVVVAKTSAQGVSFDPVRVAISAPDHPAHRSNLGGDVVKTFTSPLLMTPEQAGLAAYAVLFKHSGPSRSLTFPMVPNPALDAGDVVTVNWPGGPDQVRIQSITHPLGKGPQQVVAMPTGAPVND